ncbi:hypothetical protein CK203_060495 [Vitis vinifera]|uniref:Uncharacterized protein n=1 Tax=Vitis vinifera TaxID=29760 RepID=A0A438GT95_VITVI|nr:hypothetical protein CK203_060495 [Vitis vinifera]
MNCGSFQPYHFHSYTPPYHSVESHNSRQGAAGLCQYHGPTNYLYHYEDQVKNIVNLVLGTSELDEEGFSKEIGIVGIGDYGETLVAQSVFDQSPVGIVGI